MTRYLAFAALAMVVAGPANADTLDVAAEKYRPSMVEYIDHAFDGAKILRERVAAHDLAGAKQAWIAARTGWESAEVFTSGFVPDLDSKIDAWPNAQTGFHAIEAKLFGAGSTDVGDETDLLVYYLADLDIKIHDVRLNAQGLFNGVARLAYEIGSNKADGGESRYSGTSLADMRNNAAGIETAYRLIFADALVAADPALARAAQEQIVTLRTQLDVPDLTKIDPTKLRAASEGLVVTLQNAAPKLGLRAPTLEDLVE